MKPVIVFAFLSLALYASPEINPALKSDWVAEMRQAVLLDHSARYGEAQPIYDRISPILQDTSALPADDPLRAELANDLAAHDHQLARYP